ncbi:hypothetical protein D9V86_12165 [Bacteroidetes/Chlorobi group bacterium ChocPot_Mid]|nr:MAG: hypothetical protein D9V86_12165 [Bacteroidetes/Chlorobi group bacterium ChocPot_Mid]
MNTYNENSYTDLIYRFMDGDISSVEQNVLFGALAKDSDLQMEFQQAVTIIKGFNADKVVLAPPPSLTNNLFVSAGFNPPMPLNTVAPVGVISRLKKLTTPVISAATGALVTIAIFLGINSNNNGIIQNVSNQGNITMADSKVSVPASAIPVVRTSESKKIRHSSNNSLTLVNENQEVGFNYSRVFSTGEISSNFSTLNYCKNNSQNSTLFNNEELSSFSMPDFNYMNLEVEIKGMTGLAFLPSRTIQPEPWAIMNNIGVGIKYKFNENNRVGIVVGKESLQMYSLNKSGESLNYQYEPNLVWAGACYRYTGNEIYGAVSPYCELTGAYSKFGPVGKTAIGLEYNPENIISMSLGVEGTALAYKFLGDIKTTEKISLVYNIGIHF